MHARRATAPAQGATFEVRLPLAIADAVASDRAARDRRPRPQQRRCAPSSCDDAADLRELVAELLRMKGHEVTVVEDGAVGRRRVIRREQPDVALIDIGLPEMDGYEVARAAAHAS